MTCRIDKDEDKDSLFPSEHRTGSFSIRLLSCAFISFHERTYRFPFTGSSVQRIRIRNAQGKAKRCSEVGVYAYAAAQVKKAMESTDVEDLFIAHISGMDTLARGLRNVVKLTEAGKADFETLEKKVMDWGEPSVPSGKQELAEMIFQSAL
ncbi:hypothetical protein BHM03_00015684 [Ensete ventricosum]|nr:hypothetical protein BHM03_00015684 [Ensete ventricosum]